MINIGLKNELVNANKGKKYLKRVTTPVTFSNQFSPVDALRKGFSIANEIDSEWKFDITVIRYHPHVPSFFSADFRVKKYRSNFLTQFNASVANKNQSKPTDLTMR